MSAKPITVWTAVTALAVVLVAGLGWSWELAGELARTGHAVEQLEAAQSDEREVLQRLARLEEAVEGVRLNQNRLIDDLAALRGRLDVVFDARSER